MRLSIVVFCGLTIFSSFVLAADDDGRLQTMTQLQCKRNQSVCDVECYCQSDTSKKPICTDTQQGRDCRANCRCEYINPPPQYNGGGKPKGPKGPKKGRKGRKGFLNKIFSGQKNQGTVSGKTARTRRAIYAKA